MERSSSFLHTAFLRRKELPMTLTTRSETSKPAIFPESAFQENVALAEQTGLSPSSVSVMRNHKDTVFRLLFREKKELLSLYNALNGTNYTDENLLEIETLEHAIYIGVKDDVAFLLDSRLNIYEQQASYNPNMPLRELLYIAAHFSGFLKDESIYSSRLIKIPVPRFVVFYNGTQK